MSNKTFVSIEKSIPNRIKESFDDFWDNVPTLEQKLKVSPILLKDPRNNAFYLECHIQASDVCLMLDENAVLDPEEQEDYRANRSLQPQHRAFIQMVEDAEKGRQFSDIVAEFSREYRSDMPIKVLGGQHRILAIKQALSKGISSNHGFRIYFSLSREQRNEIAQISNTNIAIPNDLLDRMQENMLRSGLREWCQDVGLLEKDGDFADRKNQEGVITVRVARSFIVNFFKGKKMGFDSQKLYVPYLCRSSIGGTVDEEYSNLLKKRNKKLWSDKDLNETGKAFVRLHQCQISAVTKDKQLNKFSEFKIKAITPVVSAAWAMIAGAATGKKTKLTKLYSLGSKKRKTGSSDPLNAEALSTSRHHSDPDTYRGVGTRIDKKELSRMAEVFIQFVESNRDSINKNIIDAALKSCHAKIANEDAEKAKRKI